MIVVSDTTPLNYLVLIEAIDILPQLFQTVFIPPSVIVELTRSKAPLPVRQWAGASHTWLKIVPPSARLPSTAGLGDGEADAISLAKELRIADLLIDERRGRAVAEEKGWCRFRRLPCWRRPPPATCSNSSPPSRNSNKQTSAFRQT